MPDWSYHVGEQLGQMAVPLVLLILAGIVAGFIGFAPVVNFLLNHVWWVVGLYIVAIIFSFIYEDQD
jgi:uncharacterized membrane protein